MKWHWVLLLAGLVLYVLALVPGILPHTIDIPVAMLAGVTIATVAVFGFDSTQVDRRLAGLIVVISLVLLVAGIVLARQGHVYILVLLSVPAIGLGSFGLRKLIDKREKND
ncbi:MAG: hypothetical protein Q8L41_14810 [Anaerolineales bacterium]|nr:hypothetical protein [Anaerolineales bacterium]